MPDTDDLIAKAKSLGDALAAHPTVKSYFAAQQAVRDDAEARTLLQDYQNHLNHVRQLELEQKPIEVADKQKSRDLEVKMAGHDTLKTLMRTQADYVGLMNQVNGAIDAPLAQYTTRTESPQS